MTVKFPDIEVELSGQDGNAFAIIGRVQEALRRHGISDQLRSKFYDEATNGDYDHLLRTAMEWVNVT